MVKIITHILAKRIGDSLGIDWNNIDIDQFRSGLQVEQEHGCKYGPGTNVTDDNLLMTGRIAWAHLIELPDYYSRLKKMESEAELAKNA